ncbi:hypothetical protein ACFEMC_10520 [Kineococcus sp. DHX-1]|uniref:hypothetical protein n=1 Tax=Kineococcus sp. DHX-1 TaxID=3349638 RepID=UPI0036D276C8
MFSHLRRRRDRWRVERAARAFYGDCPHCRHDWRGHDPAEGCDDCLYEIGHEDPDAPAQPCRAAAPGFTFAGGAPVSPSVVEELTALPEWIVKRRARTGTVTTGRWAGDTLHVEPDDRDPQGWHLYLTGAGHGWDVWADDGRSLLQWLADSDYGFRLDEEGV